MQFLSLRVFARVCVCADGPTDINGNLDLLPCLMLTENEAHKHDTHDTHKYISMRRGCFILLLYTTRLYTQKYQQINTYEPNRTKPK